MAQGLLSDELFVTRSKPISPKTKIFLVATSAQNANFAQEILDQKALWKAAGYKEDEIACYYVPPFQEDFNADRQQFLSMVVDLSKCYLASVKQLRTHLKTITANRNDVSFLYLFLTGHG